MCIRDSIDVADSVETADGQLPNRSIWIGERAVLDVAGRAQSGIDAQGRRYGVAVSYTHLARAPATTAMPGIFPPCWRR